MLTCQISKFFVSAVLIVAASSFGRVHDERRASASKLASYLPNKTSFSCGSIGYLFGIVSGLDGQETRLLRETDWGIFGRLFCTVYLELWCLIFQLSHAKEAGPCGTCCICKRTDISKMVVESKNGSPPAREAEMGLGEPANQ